jgi:hypothetical protein
MLWQAFVIADGTATPVDPGERALDTPPAGQHDEGGLPGELTHDLHGEPERGAGPVDQVAGVAGVGPHQADRGKDRPDDPHQQVAGVAVLHVGAGDQHGQQQPGGVSDDVPLAPVDLLAGVVAATGPADRVGAAHGLGVHQRRRRLRGAALDQADLLPQRVVDAVECPVAGPDGEVVAHQRPGWEVRRQGPPDAAVVGEVADRVDDVAAWVGHRPAAPSGCRSTGRHVRRQDLPLGVAGVRRIAPRPAGGQMREAIGRVGGCVLPGDQVQTHVGPWGRARQVWLPVHLPQGPS